MVIGLKYKIMIAKNNFSFLNNDEIIILDKSDESFNKLRMYLHFNDETEFKKIVRFIKNNKNINKIIDRYIFSKDFEEKIADSKEFIIDYISDSYDRFILVEGNNGRLIGIEIISSNYPETTIYEYSTIESFMKNVDKNKNWYYGIIENTVHANKLKRFLK